MMGIPKTAEQSNAIIARAVPVPRCLAGNDSSVREDFSVLLKNKSWLILVFTGILVVVGLVARFASIVFYLKYYLLDDGTNIFLIFDRTAFLTSCGLLGQLAGALMTPMLARRFEKHHLVVTMSLLHSMLLAVCYFISPEQFALSFYFIQVVFR